MQENELLKNRVTELEKKVALLEEALLMIGKVNASDKLQQYISQKLRSAKIINLVNDISSSSLSSKKYDDAIKYISQRKAALDADIEAKMAEAQNNLVRVQATQELSAELFDYEITPNNEICITQFDLSYNADGKSKGVVVVPQTINGLPVTIIDKGAFKYSNVVKVILPNTVRHIGRSAFEGCKKLVGIILPDAITGISYGTFFECEKLQRINLPSSIVNIAEGAFWGCKSIKTIVIPPKIERIGSNCFRSCQCLEKVLINCNVKYIEEHTFYNTALKKVVIPNNVNIISEEAFSSSNHMHVLLEGKNIKMRYSGYASSAFYSPTTFYYANKFILRDLYEYIKRDEKQFTIDHNVENFYKLPD